MYPLDRTQSTRRDTPPSPDTLKSRAPQLYTEGEPPYQEGLSEIPFLRGPLVLQGVIVVALLAIFLCDILIRSKDALDVATLYPVAIILSVLLWSIRWVTGVTVASMILNLIGMHIHQIRPVQGEQTPVNHLLVLIGAQLGTGLVCYQMIVTQRRYERDQQTALTRQRELYLRERNAREALQQAREDAERQAQALADTLKRERHARERALQARDEREKLRQLTENFQRALLPTIPTTAARGQLVLGELYQPAIQEMQMGGDFYDVITLPNDCVGLVIGDIAGHGVEAAAGTAIAVTTLRAYAVENPLKPAQVVERINRTLTQQDHFHGFVSLVYGVYDPSTGLFTYANAGHEPPIVMRRCGLLGDLAPTGMVAGINPEATYQESCIKMTPDDCLVLITDGLTEARSGRSGRLLGWQGAAYMAEEHCRGYSGAMSRGDPGAARSMAESIFKDACRFASPEGASSDDSGLTDDLALLVVYFTRQHVTDPPR
jgi:serine phosphatase RsbU (regulator of sigma subunit)